jgi:hypothetical protein
MHPNQENAPATVPSVESQSMDAFYRDLPELLKHYNWKWVAYHGDRMVGLGRTKTELYQKCLRDGLREGEFAVLLVHEMALTDNEEVNIPDF